MKGNAESKNTMGQVFAWVVQLLQSSLKSSAYRQANKYRFDNVKTRLQSWSLQEIKSITSLVSTIDCWGNIPKPEICELRNGEPLGGKKQTKRYTSTRWVPEINNLPNFLNIQYLEGRVWKGKGSKRIVAVNPSHTRGHTCGEILGKPIRAKDSQKA